MKRKLVFKLTNFSTSKEIIKRKAEEQNKIEIMKTVSI